MTEHTTEHHYTTEVRKAIHRRQISFINLIKREIWRFLKVYFQTIVGPVVTGILFMIVFATSLRGHMLVVDGVPFVTFLGAGLAMMILMQNAFANTSSSISSMKVYGTFSDILSAPVGNVEIVSAFLIGGIVRGVVTGGCCLLVFLLFVDFNWHQPAIMVLFAILGSSLLALFGIIAGIWSQKWDHQAAFTNFIVTPLSFLSGTFYSIERLPDFFYEICLYNPFFHAINGFRYGLTGVSDVNIESSIAFLLALNLFLYWLTIKLFQSGWRIKS